MLGYFYTLVDGRTECKPAGGMGEQPTKDVMHRQSAGVLNPQPREVRKGTARARRGARDEDARRDHRHRDGDPMRRPPAGRSDQAVGRRCRRPLIQTVNGSGAAPVVPPPVLLPKSPTARTRFSGTQRGVGRVSPRSTRPLGHYAADAGRARPSRATASSSALSLKVTWTRSRQEDDHAHAPLSPDLKAGLVEWPSCEPARFRETSVARNPRPRRLIAGAVQVPELGPFHKNGGRYDVLRPRPTVEPQAPSIGRSRQTAKSQVVRIPRTQGRRTMTALDIDSVDPNHIQERALDTDIACVRQRK